MQPPWSSELSCSVRVVFLWSCCLSIDHRLPLMLSYCNMDLGSLIVSVSVPVGEGLRVWRGPPGPEGAERSHAAAVDDQDQVGGALHCHGVHPSSDGPHRRRGQPTVSLLIGNLLSWFIQWLLNSALLLGSIISNYNVRWQFLSQMKARLLCIRKKYFAWWNMQQDNIRDQ